jgi:serine/threonine protein phosphatase PrpC
MSNQHKLYSLKSEEPKHWLTSLQGKRQQNEDKHNVLINIDGKHDCAPINFYAVYDGHGGKFVSNFLSQNLPQCFLHKKVVYPLKKTFIKKIYNYWQNELVEKHKRYSTNTGSTCLVVVHYKESSSEYLNILNTGDSRVVICKNNIGVALNKDHKPNWPEELARIKKLGGDVEFDGYDWRIQDLSVSRAFGDLSATPYVTHMPELFKYKISCEDKFIVVACDGLWDVFSCQDVVNYILDNCYDLKTNKRINKTLNIAKKLGEHAIEKGSTDNITAIVVFFD